MIPRFFIPQMDVDGYWRIHLSVVGKRQFSMKASRLVALTFIENDAPDTKTEVDHLNQVRSDDRVENLEWVTPTEQQRRRASGQRLRGSISSRLIGVTWNRRDEAWYAQVWVRGKRVHIGYFKDEILAAHAYDDYVRAHGLDNPINDWSSELKA